VGSESILRKHFVLENGIIDGLNVRIRKLDYHSESTKHPGDKPAIKSNKTLARAEGIALRGLPMAGIPAG